MLLHSVLVQDQAVGADAVLQFDLGVNPLSVILINIRILNSTGTPANYVAWLEAIESINRISVLHRGLSVISMSGLDAAMLAMMRHNAVPWMANASLTDNDRIMATLPIFLGRGPYDMKSCFPSSRRGELILELDIDVADTGYDGYRLSVETIEILDAKPTEYERKVQLSQTFLATGINDIDLPLGNLVRGLMMFQTTPFTGAVPVPTLGRLSLVADGVGVGYSSIDIESVFGLPGILGRQMAPYDGHIHKETDTGGPTQLPQEIGTAFANHAYLDFDPLGDDAHSINAADVSRLQLRCDAESANAVRVIPIERIKV